MNIKMNIKSGLLNISHINFQVLIYFIRTLIIKVVITFIYCKVIHVRPKHVGSKITNVTFSLPLFIVMSPKCDMLTLELE